MDAWKVVVRSGYPGRFYTFSFQDRHSAQVGSVRSTLPQCACDRRETRNYNRGLHGACHKGVDGRRVAAPKESAGRIPSLTENDIMFFRLCRRVKRRKCPRGQSRAPWHAIALQLKLPNDVAAKKMTSRET